MLKLLALDEEDLAIVSAHMQDAVFRVEDASFSPKAGTFTIIANRFVWESAHEQSKSFERRRAVLVFKQVRAVRSTGFNRKADDQVLDLLALTFEKQGDGPEGYLELVLAGGAAILLNVDCIEVQLADTGGAWETTVKPRHPAKP